MNWKKRAKIKRMKKDPLAFFRCIGIDVNPWQERAFKRIAKHIKRKKLVIKPKMNKYINHVYRNY